MSDYVSDPVLEAALDEIDERLYTVCYNALDRKMKRESMRDKYDEISLCKAAIDIWLNDVEFLTDNATDLTSAKERLARTMYRIRNLTLSLRTLRTIYRNTGGGQGGTP